MKPDYSPPQLKRARRRSPPRGPSSAATDSDHDVEVVWAAPHLQSPARMAGAAHSLPRPTARRLGSLQDGMRHIASGRGAVSAGDMRNLTLGDLAFHLVHGAMDASAATPQSSAMGSDPLTRGVGNDGAGDMIFQPLSTASSDPIRAQASSAGRRYSWTVGVDEEGDGAVIQQPMSPAYPDPDLEVAGTPGPSDDEQQDAVHANPAPVLDTMDWTEAVVTFRPMSPWRAPASGPGAASTSASADAPGPSNTGASRHGAAPAPAFSYFTALAEAENLRSSISDADIVRFVGRYPRGSDDPQQTTHRNQLALIRVLDRHHVQKLDELRWFPKKARGEVDVKTLATDLGLRDGYFQALRSQLKHNRTRNVKVPNWMRVVVERFSLGEGEKPRGRAARTRAS